MMFFLANAEPSDTSGAAVVTVVIGVTVVLLVGALMLVPIVVARRRAHRRIEGIKLVAFLWALLSAAGLIYAQINQTQWSAEYDRQLRTGYLDPHSPTAMPDWPTPVWLRLLWVGLGAAYLGLLLFSALGPTVPPPDETPPA